TGVALFVLLGSALSLLCEKLRRAQATVRRYAEKSEQRARDLVRADQRKNEFLSVLAHELRNPLAPILNAVSVLRQLGGVQPEVRTATAVIERQALHALRLIEDLLDVASISLGKFSLRTGPLELAEVVARAVEECRPLIEARKQELTVL